MKMLRGRRKTSVRRKKKEISMAKAVSAAPVAPARAPSSSHDWLSIVSVAMSTLLVVVGIGFFAGGEWKEYQSMKAAVTGREWADQATVQKLLQQALENQAAALRTEFETKIKEATKRAVASPVPEKPSPQYKLAVYRLAAETNRATVQALGSHRLCFLSSYGDNNEENNRASNCRVEHDNGIWHLRATGAFCSGTCVD
jgi:hypothetical protein